MAQLLKGKEVAETIDKEIMDRLPSLYEKNIVPTIAIVRVGEKPDDIAYERGAVNRAKKLGVEAEKFICPADIEEEDLIAVLESINDNDKLHGVLLLQPLPEHMDADRVRNTISSEKDLDCVSQGALGQFMVGVDGSFAPCTAESCIKILKHYEIEIHGKNVVVIGRSLVIGRPVALLVMNEQGTITICHSRTPREELIDHCQKADIIISATGRIGTVTKEMVREGQTIIDVGINFTEEGKMVGDVAFDEVSEIVSAITPVPGGVGSVTTSLLMEHLVEKAMR